MNLNKTDITMILDKSGSMGKCRSVTIEAVNAFINKSREGVGECRFSLIQFDDKYEINYVDVDLNHVAYLTDKTYEPRGWTALYDAIGKTIASVGSRLANLKEQDRPATVMIVIQTDGVENMSKEFNLKQIADMITHQREKYNWQFVFLGAHIDAVKVAQDIAIPTSAALQYDTRKSFVAMDALATYGNTLRSARSGGNTSATYQVEEKDRANMMVPESVGSKTG